MRVSVPKMLKGGTLGQAHKWARSQSDSLEYILENPTGKKVSLADIISGSVSEVNIVGTRKNPAHPAEFEPVTYGMNRSVNLTYILPDEVSPAMVTAMVQNEGLFGAVQSLSILLNREIKDGHALTPGAMAILSARTWSPNDASVDSRLIGVDTLLTRKNPAPLGIGRSMGGRILGKEIAQTDVAMKNWVQELVTGKPSVSANVDTAQIDMFVRNVMTPYLLSSQANQAALQYISTYVLPSVNEHSKKDFQSEFRYMAEHMATNPKDFYYGRTNAILAHPAFLFPHYGVISLPPLVGMKKQDKAPLSKIEAMMLDAGNPPKFNGNVFVPRSTYKGFPPVEYLNMAVYGAASPQTIDWTFLSKSMKKLGRGGGIGFLKAVAAATDESIVLETVEEPAAYVEAFKQMSKKKSKDFIGDLANKPVLFVMDLPGMRPRPINWPDKLIMAAMEVISKHRSKQTEYLLPFEANDFLRPSSSMDFGEVEIEVNKKKYTVDFNTPDYMTRLTQTAGKDISKVLTALHKKLQDNPSTTIAVSKGLSLVSTLEDAISLSISKYGYEPTDEDIKMATAIIITTMNELKDKSGYTKVETLAEKMMAETIKLQKSEAKSARNKVDKAIKQMQTHPSKLDRLVALMALRKALGGL